MTQKLSVRVVVDPDVEDVRLAVTGRIDKTNRWALIPVIRRACALLMRGQVLVDLRNADGDTQAAATAVHEAMEHGSDAAGHHHVHVALPDEADHEWRGDQHDGNE